MHRILMMLLVLLLKEHNVAKLWLTEKHYSLVSSLLRIGYWLGALYLSYHYMQIFSQHALFKVGLVGLSIVLLLLFLIWARCIDHLFKGRSS